MTRDPDVRIRPYDKSDALALFEAVRASSLVLEPWMPWCTPTYALSDAHAWIEMQVEAFGAGTGYEFAITTAANQFLGGCGVNRLDPINRRANLGYWVRSEQQGQGIATAAARLAIAWAFERTPIVRIEVLIARDNRPSRRVAEKLGAVLEGTLRSRLYLRGVFHDAVLLSIVRR